MASETHVQAVDSYQLERIIEELRDQTYAAHTGNLIAYLATVQGQPHSTKRSVMIDKLEKIINERMGLDTI